MDCPTDLNFQIDKGRYLCRWSFQNVKKTKWDIFVLGFMSVLLLYKIFFFGRLSLRIDKQQDGLPWKNLYYFKTSLLTLFLLSGVSRKEQEQWKRIKQDAWQVSRRWWRNRQALTSHLWRILGTFQNFNEDSPKILGDVSEKNLL